jgi:hypothetical protein
MMALDKQKNWKHMPLKLYGSHSLELLMAIGLGEATRESTGKDI